MKILYIFVVLAMAMSLTEANVIGRVVSGVVERVDNMFSNFFGSIGWGYKVPTAVSEVSTTECPPEVSTPVSTTVPPVTGGPPTSTVPEVSTTVPPVTGGPSTTGVPEVSTTVPPATGTPEVPTTEPPQETTDASETDGPVDGESTTYGPY